MRTLLSTAMPKVRITPAMPGIVNDAFASDIAPRMRIELATSAMTATIPKPK